MKRTLFNWLGLSGIVSLVSYTLAVCLSPLAYEGYDWLSQAVSDLSAETAPSRTLWDQLSCAYMPCGIACCTAVSLFAAGRFDRTLRVGIDLFTAMNFVSAVGYAAFPLTAAGEPEGFQNVMHLAVTAFVVLLSVASLLSIAIGGLRKRTYPSLAVWAIVALAFMLLGAIGTNVLPKEYFGIPERFSVFAAAGFNAVLGLYLFFGFPKKGE